jgi:PAT family beta-lactamase induction signal transducer AmpG
LVFKSHIDNESQQFNDPKDDNSRIQIFLNSVIKPIGSIKFITLIVAFLILYRLSDNFIAQMINPFLINIGYDEIEVASVGKFFGILGSIIGGLAASLVMKNRTITDSLLIFGLFHAIAHSFFIIQEIYGKNIVILFFVIGFESITGGMTMAAYIALIASLCQGKFRATQYSFLSSMMGLSRSVLPTISGYIVYDFGWQAFFIFTTLAAFPSLFLIGYIKSGWKN